MMDTRELLTKAIVGVIKQRRPSRDSGFCVYRSPEGLMCAVGHLIDDEYYKPAIEGKEIQSGEGVADAVEQSIGRALNQEEIGFLRTLQACHDMAERDDFVDDFAVMIARDVKVKRLPRYCLDIIAEAQK